MNLLRKWVLIGFFLAVSVFLYNKQLGAIPFLLLSIFFFAAAYKERKKFKNGRKERGEGIGENLIRVKK
jgi:chromate transport protein ChrA